METKVFPALTISEVTRTVILVFPLVANDRLVRIDRKDSAMDDFGDSATTMVFSRLLWMTWPRMGIWVIFSISRAFDDLIIQVIFSEHIKNRQDQAEDDGDHVIQALFRVNRG